jgi:hypothetical protein
MPAALFNPIFLANDVSLCRSYWTIYRLLKYTRNLLNSAPTRSLCIHADISRRYVPELLRKSWSRAILLDINIPFNICIID